MKLIYAIKAACDTQFPYPEVFLEILADFPNYMDSDAVGSSTKDFKIVSTPASADWWVSLAIAHRNKLSLWKLFLDVHISVRAILNILRAHD
jgi:hypothetical protein